MFVCQIYGDLNSEPDSVEDEDPPQLISRAPDPDPIYRGGPTWNSDLRA